MKIQIASDLHFELWKRNLSDPVGQFAPDKERDLLILAGDIVDGNRDHGLPFIRRELKLSPVIFVPGNHEYHHAPKRKWTPSGAITPSGTPGFIISTMTRWSSGACASTAPSGARISGATRTISITAR